MLKIYNIIEYPHKKLRTKSSDFTEKDLNCQEFQDFVDSMIKTMLKKDGVGLAGSQIGLNKRIIIVNTKNGPICMVNPNISKKSWASEYDQEGCLSVPKVFGLVKRHKRVTCNYIDRDGKKKTITGKGLLARVIQHEIDHLDGILFIDKAINIEKN